ncbi:hypothetical protein [Aquimarina algicola]|uniref:hypothetical protein n=1 Tax=Aquimarina algicola TaxID=2589995 RepID=UPI001CF3749A|nr:hypothetical protein [Aquimarina algicola]
MIGGAEELNDNSDVIVTFDNNSKYIATFFIYVKAVRFYSIDGMFTQPNWTDGHQEDVDTLIKYLEN